MKQTQKSLVGVLALLVLAVGIAFAAAWVGRDEEKKAEQKEKAEKLFDFDKAKVKSLRLEKDSALVAAAEKSGTAWKLTEPVQADGDDSALNGVVEALSSLKQKKDLGDEKDGKPFGLDKPHLRVSVKLEDGKEQALELGTENSFDNTVYARRSGDPTIRVVEGSTKGSFEKTAFDLRDKRVARVEDEVKRVDVTGVKQPYSLVKEGAAWKLEQPVALPADTGTADGVVNAVKNLRATAIAAEKAAVPAQFGFALPKATVKLGSRTVTFAQADGKTYARRDDSPVVYEVDAQILKDLNKEIFDLQDKQLVHVDREQVRKFAFKSASGEVAIERRKEKPADGGVEEEVFRVVAPQEAPAKKWKVSSALYSVVGLRAGAFAAPKKAPPSFDRTITLYGEGDKVLATVRIGGEDGTRRYVESGGKLALVEKATLDDLPWKLEDAAEAASIQQPDAGAVPVSAK